ncbi:histone deacetylase [Desulfosarcina sp. OttesenSCG-928-A07]|nr:histone deacetylase [Desulfosarcina sp. OttesenSCG-928-A07]
MKRTGYLYDDRYQDHDTGSEHPESADRLATIHANLRSAGLLDWLIPIRATRADIRWLHAVHPPHYIRRFEEVCLSGNSCFDFPDNQMCVSTYDTAFLAVGGVIETARRIMADEMDNAFCAIRPPGHHAEADLAMGFCYFNNVAIAARYLQQAHGIQRVAIIDIDVHHGNGTQHIFEDDPTVFYYSIHEHPSFSFPGSGRDFERGTGPGEGFTKNSLVLPGQGDDTYKTLIQQDLLPAMEMFKPEFILVSCGFDAHEADDMADIELSRDGYIWVMKTILQLADQYTHSRIISVLEGGYCLEWLGKLAVDHVRVLLEG